MAIESVNLTVPGGDTPRSAFTKINYNFSNNSHAASRLVGTSNGNVVEMTSNGIANTGLGGFGVVLDSPNLDLNTVVKPGIYTAALASPVNSPASTLTGVMTVTNRAYTAGTSVLQDLTIDSDGKRLMRVGSGGTNNVPASWSPWGRMVVQSNNDIYQLTTASGANVTIDSSGYLRRSTSSERYKDIIADLELDDEAYQNAMQLSPIVYRSTAEADNPDYHYYSFSAEKLGAYDPAFTLWRETETVTDDEGNVTEQPLDERQAEGINLNAIVAFLHATNIKQGKLIKDLQDQVNALKPASTQQPTN